MKNLICICLTFFSVSAWSVNYGAFTAFNEQFKDVEGSKNEITDMPALRSQDSIGICYATMAATLLNYDNCRQNNRRTGKVVKCDTVPEDLLFSSIGLARLGGDLVKNEDLESSFDSMALNGGSPSNIITRMYALGSAPAENCVSIDRILSKIGGADTGIGEKSEKVIEAQEAVWSQLQNLHGMSSGQTPEESLKKYGSTIQQCLGFKVSNESMLRAFGQTTYEGFLNKLLIDKKCDRSQYRAAFEGREKTELKTFPAEGTKTNFEGALKKIQNTIDAGYPMALNNICLDATPKPLYQVKNVKPKDIPDGYCKEPHGVVISGYKRVCAGKECYDAIKVINSWGKSYQKSIEGGWVKADLLLNRTTYEEGMLSWIQDRPVKK